MLKKLPFFGLVTPRSPMNGLVEHYEKIVEGVSMIREALECYISGSGVCREFKELTADVDAIEDHADKIKRNIRNHLPRRLFMPVDKTLFLNYTRFQDNILDYAQEALHWLGMRRVSMPEEEQKPLIDLVDEVTYVVELVGPALKKTIGLVHGEHIDRLGCKEQYRKIRRERQKIMKMQRALVAEIYNSDMDFKDIYQLIHFVGCLNDTVKNCEACADTLRAMIAR